MAKYGYKEIRRMEARRLRSLCIEKGWYTQGDNKAYQHLLYDVAEKLENITTDDLVEIAEDILEHSETDYDIPSVMFELARICHTTIEEI